ncbi:MAG TPA: N-methyl-L-tryptophan oxidase [Actinomycetota bacterium]|nr:N-methyl-L-tryptophan oxidase [Actinomycetota bacterium]
MRAVVVGAGVMGAATARALARAGHEVTVFEQFAFGHARGSSHGESRVFRFSYPDPAYVAMAVEALPLWRDLESETGEELLRTTGGLDRGKALDDHVEALQECGAECEVLEADEACARFPWLGTSDGPVLFQPDGGVIAADRSVRAFLRSAAAHGAVLRDETKVLSVDPASGGVVVETERGPLRAEAAVVAAGAWAKELVAPLGVDLPTRPTRETVAYFELDEPRLAPLVEWGEPTVYALPSTSGLLKAAEHIAGPTTDPDETGETNDESVRKVSDWVARTFPAANPAPRYTETCLYTNTPDESFVLARHGDVVIGSPCSGHGFKFAPLIGKRLAELATA